MGVQVDDAKFDPLRELTACSFKVQNYLTPEILVVNPTQTEAVTESQIKLIERLFQMSENDFEAF